MPQRLEFAVKARETHGQILSRGELWSDLYLESFLGNGMEGSKAGGKTSEGQWKTVVQRWRGGDRAFWKGRREGFRREQSKA